MFVSNLSLVIALATSSVAQDNRSSTQSKPEYIGVVYYLSSVGRLTALDRQVPQNKSAMKPFRFGAQITTELDGDRASLRIRSGEDQSFVVTLPPRADPRRIRLYLFSSKAGKRELTAISSAGFGNPRVQHPIQLNISKYEDDSYKLTPLARLGAGEYAFFMDETEDLYSFGVDKD
jgi:hypothetical protein